MGTATVTASPIGVSWEEVKEWDERYDLRPSRSLDAALAELDALWP
jgi:hypothetical protein